MYIRGQYLALSEGFICFTYLLFLTIALVEKVYTGHIEEQVVLVELLETERDERVVRAEQLLQLGYLQSVHH